jgi:hypothetical protein
MELLVAQEGRTLLSVGHRPELEGMHMCKIELARRTGGAKRVRDASLCTLRLVEFPSCVDPPTCLMVCFNDLRFACGVELGIF